MSDAKNNEMFLVNNWNVVLADPTANAHLRVIHVSNGVGSVTNGKVMLRCPVNAPNGFYLYNERLELISQDPYLWRKYPEPMGWWQRFEINAQGPYLNRELIAGLISWLEHARQLKVNVVVDKYGILPVARHGYNANADTRPHFPFGFELPLGNQEVMLDPRMLKLALVEMMRYDYCHMLHNVRYDCETPLVLGHSWDRCALVMPVA